MTDFEIMKNIGRFTWTTKDGRNMEWRDMTTNHLRNASALLERSAARQLDNAAICAGYGDENGAGNAMDECFDTAARLKQVSAMMVRYAGLREEQMMIVEGP